MRSAQLFFVCCLSATSAASECADQSCEGKDAASLLQSAIQVHEVETSSKQASQTVDCSTLTEDTCDGQEGGVCNWNPKAQACATGCSVFDNMFNGKKPKNTKQKKELEAACQKDYCFYIKGNSNFRCKSATDLNFGGKRASKGGFSRTKEKKGEPQSKGVPQYVTTERQLKNEEWESCAGDVDCWRGAGSHTGSHLEATLSSSTYTTVAAEVAIKCEYKGELEISFGQASQTSSNAIIQMWYNLTPIKEGTTAITSADRVPVFRVEMSRSPGSIAAAFAYIKVLAKNVKLAFDECMDYKAKHGQCLEVFSEGGAELRSDHKTQVKCLDGDDAVAQTITDCPEWKKCLDPDVAAVLSKALKALEPTSSAMLAQDLSRVPCTPEAHGSCVNPASLDIEGFDCDCFDWMDGASPQEITDGFCGDDRVCCAWKDSHCGTAFLQHAANESTQNAMTTRGQQKKDAQEQDVTSLDESLSGKRTC